MIQRIQQGLWFAVCGLALGTFAVAAFAADKAPKADTTTHSGAVVSAAAGKLVMTGKDKKEHAHDVMPTAKIMVNDAPAKLEDLKKGMMVTVTLDKSGKVIAVTSPVAAKTPAKPKATKTGAAPAKIVK